MKTLTVQFLSLCLTAQAFGADGVSPSADGGKSPHHKGLISSLNLGIRYSSLLENRGIIFYRDFQIDPVLGLFFFDDRVEFLGDSIGYRDFIAGDWLRWRTRLVSLTDKPLFPAHDSIKAGAPQRSDTYEWENSLEIFFPGYNDRTFAEFDLRYSKELGDKYGHYAESQLKVKVTDFRVPGIGVKIEPNVFGLIGAGDYQHNRHFYGPGAHDGFSNIAYGLWLAFPEEADRYYPIVQIRRFETIGRARDGAYAQGRDEGWLFSFIATYGFLE